MVKKQGVDGHNNGLPILSVEFACKAAEDPVEEVRKHATAILKIMKEKGAR